MHDPRHAHALQRCIERVPGVTTEEQAIAVLQTAFIDAAARFGARYVRLGTGNRVVIQNGAVVTVLPADMKPRTKVIKRAHRKEMAK